MMTYAAKSSEEHTSCISLTCSPKHPKLSKQHVLGPILDDRITVAQFKQYRDPALFIAITEADCYVIIKEFQLVEIRNIVEHADRTIQFVARRVHYEQPLYVNPLHSTKVGVHVICRYPCDM